MTKAKHPLKVFISYASQDRHVVRELSQRLFYEGWVDPWVDEKKLLPGQDWRLEIEEAVETSDVVIICLSSNSVGKEGFVQKELRYAKEIALEKPDGTIFLVPLRLDECDVPRGLRFLQWVDYYGEEKDKSYHVLVKSLKSRHEQMSAVEDQEIVKKEKVGQGATEKDTLKEIHNNPKQDTSDTKQENKPWKLKSEYIIAAIGAAATIIAGILGSPLIEERLSSVSTSTETAMVSTFFASTLQPTETLTPAATLTPSVTPTYTPTFVLPESGYTIVDPADVFKLVAKTDPFGKIAKEEYTSQEINSVNRTLFYTIDGTPDQPMQWRWYWCATTEEILKQNVNGIDVVFQADGRLIPHEQLAFTTYSYPKDNGGTGWCATYSTVVKDWEPGVYHFVIASTLKSVINDGEATFLPGFQISDFTVKIREPALKTEIVDDKGVQMALVLGSSFQMGGGAKVDQQPIHAVYLNSYYIDAYEVSNVLYKACVDAKVCQPPKDLSSTTHPSYYTDPRFNNYPVVSVNWSEADTYCQWRDARLPTEAEWEKAARGVGGRTYPWGNLLECTYANYLDVGETQCFVTGDTTPVDKYIKGVSPFGVYGLVGNVWEWVSDWYSETYYSISPLGNPQGADSGQYRVIRGGSWKDDSKSMLPTLRNWYDPESYSNTIGFRCAKDAP